MRAASPIILACAALAACGTTADQPVSIGYGASPELPEPSNNLIPIVNVQKATGWPDGARPVAAEGLQVQAFATGLDHPRALHVLPNGDVLVAETNAPPRPQQGQGIRGFFMKQAMEKAGAAVPSANRISLLRDTDGDGIAETRHAFLEGLNSPYGMQLVGDTLYVANTDAIIAFPYEAGATSIDAPGTTLTTLPAGPVNYHWTKNIIASPDGTKLYAAVGSNSNIAENGLAAEEGRAAIWEVDIATGEKRLYATGLRNPVGLAFNDASGKLWTAVNERDELGNNLVPDYVTSVDEGAFYGWPWSYYGQTVDTRVQPVNAAKVAAATAPDYALGSHTASLGIAFADGAALGPDFEDGLFVGQHGSWNRKPAVGYKVVFVPFAGTDPDGMPVDVLTGFLDGNKARGRPVDTAIANDGALLVTDDVGNVVWRVAAAQ
ncbi:PQQ-dependent sugar dehydrogenase [Henriciella marina]|uniref:PQQ-dependent sugar dehydrogenase n=1 Tax=Henriciella marina TaxID=453851 RepID=UPI00036796D9|nr:sorbosone dehydrogenase family protein [Henriciella marina]